MRFPTKLFIAAAATLAGGVGTVFAQPRGRDAGQLYVQLCSSCHGEKFEGGKGPSLISGVWKHGGDHASLLRSIRDGYPLSGMPGFATALNDAELQAMIIYLRERATRAVDPQPQGAAPLPTTVQHSEVHDYRIESVAEGLDVPWSMAFLPDGRILVTERVGRLRIIDHGRLLPEAVEGLPKPVVRDEAGLLSVVAHPDFAHNHWIYLSYCDPGEGDTAMTKIIRGRLEDGKLTGQRDIFSIPRASYPKGWASFGCRLVFDGDYLFFTVGDRWIAADAQDVKKPNGKVHRVFDDGRIPPDNPFVHEAGAFGSVWSYGHRNPQGLALDPVTGDLWETEHGPRGGDELNHIERGHNYGWPVITYGMNYDGTPISDHTEQAGMEQPVVNWTPSIAVSEISFYTGDRFPKWKNQLFIGSLAQQKFLRFVVNGDRVTHQEQIFKGLGRVRDIKTGPDGLLYIALELPGHPGRIVRLVPAE